TANYGINPSGPSISSVSPTSGLVGTAVTITGTNFGATQGSSTVTFNGTSVGTPSSWSATSIAVVVPSSASSGNVVVTVGGVISNGAPFTVTLSPFVPTTGVMGSHRSRQITTRLANGNVL